jgi:hypothetical protein
MLNTGKGGTVYLGIVDSGNVRGLSVTSYQVYLHTGLSHCV